MKPADLKRLNQMIEEMKEIEKKEELIFKQLQYLTQKLQNVIYVKVS